MPERVAAFVRSGCRHLRGRRRACRPHGGAGGGAARRQRRRARRPARRLERIRPSARHGDAGLRSADRRPDRTHRLRRHPRTLVAVEARRRFCPGQRDRRIDAGHRAQRRRAGGLQRRCRRSADQPAADARRGFRNRSGGLAGRSRARSSSRPIIISTASIIPRRFRSTAANTSTALRRWRGGQGRGSSRTRRSSASTRRAFASASSRRRRGCAPRTSCSPATSISARRCGGCRKRCCRSGATPAVTAPLGERLAEAITFQGSVTDSDGIDHFRIVDGDRLMWASRKPPGRRGRSVLPAPLRAGSARFFPSSERSRSPRSGAARSDRPCTACRRSASCARACGSPAASAARA